MLFEPFFRQFVGDLPGRATRAVGPVEDFGQGVADGIDVGANCFRRGAGTFVKHIDDATGVDGEIGRIENAPVPQHSVMLRVFQQVIGRAGHNAGLQLRNAGGVQYCAHGTGGDHVYWQEQDVLSGGWPGSQLVHRAPHVVFVNVVHPKLGTCLLQVFGQPETDIANALDGHLQPAQVILAQFVFYCCLQADKAAVGGCR